MPPSFFRHFLTSCLSSEISHFTKEPQFLLVRNNIVDQDLGARCTCCYWNFPVGGAKKYMHVLTCTYTYIFTHTYPSVHMSAYTSIPSFNLHPHRLLSCLLHPIFVPPQQNLFSFPQFYHTSKIVSKLLHTCFTKNKPKSLGSLGGPRAPAALPKNARR